MLGKACSAFRKSETVWSKSETSQVKSAPSYFTLETRLGSLSPTRRSKALRMRPEGTPAIMPCVTKVMSYNALHEPTRLLHRSPVGGLAQPRADVSPFPVPRQSLTARDQ